MAQWYDWKRPHRREVTDRDNPPPGYKHWDEKAGRWYKRAPQEHKEWKDKRKWMYDADGTWRYDRFRKGIHWKARLRALENYRLSVRWAEIRKQILDRDGHECQMCGKVDCRLEVHHLEYPDELGTERPETLITLCKDCHRSIHYKEDGKRRYYWRRHNPPPVLPEGENNA